MKKFLLSILCALTLLACDEPNKASLTVVNQSGYTITSLNVSLSSQRQSQSKTNIKNGEKVMFTFHDFSDAHYIVRGELANKVNVQGNFGYITNGFDFESTLIVQKNGATVFESKPIDSK